MALDPPHAAAASALRIRPIKTAFVAVTAAAIHCRKYVENQVVEHADAAAAWEWRMLNSLAILAWLKIFLKNALEAGPRAPLKLSVHTQPALRTGLMAPACRLLHVFRRAIPDLT